MPFQQRYHEQQQANSTDCNLLSQVPPPSILRPRSIITPTPASKTHVTNIPRPATTIPEDPNLLVQDAHLLDLF
jgi:hypothetical protein